MLRPEGLGPRRPPTERWQSGRSHRTRNAAYGQPYRGFESLPLRHPTPLRGYGRQTTYTRSAIFTKTLTVTAEQMPLTNRNPLALFYSSFLFGNLAVPYYYVVLGILLPN